MRVTDVLYLKSVLLKTSTRVSDMAPYRLIILSLLLFSFGASAQQSSISEGIRPQPLSDAIREFAEQTGLQVVFESS